ncbi:hypothetical protein ADUPG1_005713, partial [Aduncisulcus paluster]
EETSSLKKRPDGIWANKEGLAVVPSADSSLKNMLMEFDHGKGKAHLGEEASREVIVALGITWKGIRLDIHKHIQSCLICQKLRLRQHGIQYSRSTAAVLPFET